MPLILISVSIKQLIIRVLGEQKWVTMKNIYRFYKLNNIQKIGCCYTSYKENKLFQKYLFVT